MSNGKNKAEKQVEEETSYNKVALLELFVVASIAYMSVVIWMGTDGYEAKALTAPAVIWATLKLIQKFSK